MDILDKTIAQLKARGQTPKAYDTQINKVLNHQGQTEGMLSPSNYPKDNPLTHTGKKVMSKMTSSYGDKKGKQVFYATANKNPALGKKLHK